MSSNGKKPARVVTYGHERTVQPVIPTKARYGGGAKGQPRRVADWAAIDAQTLLDAVAAVTAIGDAIVLGLTPDGGAFAITVYTEGDRPKFYPSTPEDCEDRLRDITADARAAKEDG